MIRFINNLIQRIRCWIIKRRLMSNLNCQIQSFSEEDIIRSSAEVDAIGRIFILVTKTE